MDNTLTPLQQKVLARYKELVSCLRDLDSSIKDLNQQQLDTKGKCVFTNFTEAANSEIQF